MASPDAAPGFRSAHRFAVRRARAAAALALAVSIGAAAAGCAAEPAREAETAPPPPFELSGGPIAVVGDSISAAFNACAAIGDCEEVSWAIGADPAVDSLASRVERDTSSASIERVSAAVTGARLADALTLVPEVVEREPELVAVLIGANDACAASVDAMTDVDDFRDDFERLLSSLREGLPDAGLLVLSVPDLHRLWQSGRVEPRAVERWDLGRSCAALLGDSASDDPAVVASREAVRERVRELNAVMASACEATAGCVHDDGATFEHEFSLGDVSAIDYFHPSIEGQRELARIAWETLEAAGAVG